MGYVKVAGHLLHTIGHTKQQVRIPSTPTKPTATRTGSQPSPKQQSPTGVRRVSTLGPGTLWDAARWLSSGHCLLTVGCVPEVFGKAEKQRTEDANK